MPEDITLHTSGHKQVTVVSNTFIDNYMSEANGEYVKIYLYLLRCLSHNGQSFSVSQMADKFDHTDKDIKRALRYWEEHHLLRLEFSSTGELIGICLLDPQNSQQTDSSTEEIALQVNRATSTVSDSAASDSIVSLSQSAAPAKEEKDVPSYSREQMEAFQENSEIQELLFIVQSYLRHTLSVNDMETVIYWYDSLKLNVNVIDYLVTYCIEKNHSSIRYMNKIALSYHEEGITTVEEAKARNNMHSKTYFTVAKSLGITNRSLTQNEQEMIEKWTKIYKIPMDLISEACQRTITATNKPAFKYTDKILKSWYDNKAKTLEDVAKLDSAHGKYSNNAKKPAPVVNNFHNFAERNNDYDELEKKLLQVNLRES